MAKPKKQSKGSAKRKVAASTRRAGGSKAGKANAQKGPLPTRRAAAAKALAKGKAAALAKRSKAGSKGASKTKAPKAARAKVAPKSAPAKVAPKAARAKVAPKAAPKSAPKAAPKTAPKSAPAKAAPKAKARPGKASASTASEQRTLPAIELAPPARKAKAARGGEPAGKGGPSAAGKAGAKAMAKGGKRPGGEAGGSSGTGRKATKRPPAPQQLELPVLGSPAGLVRTSDEPRSSGGAATEVAPFRLIETSPGSHSLLLTEFGPSAEVFARYGVEAGGYAWESLARHLLEEFVPHLRGRLGLDPESSMFCAYGKDAAALTELGGMLAALYHAPDDLAKLIERLGPDEFLD